MMTPERREPPLPHDREAADRLRSRFAELSADARRFAEGADGSALLSAIGGNSPFLFDLALREPAVLLDAMAGRGPDAALAEALESLRRPGAADAKRDAVGAALRVAKRRVALLAAVADLSGRWPLDRVTGALSELAEAAIGLACAHLLGAAVARGELRPFRPDGHGSLEGSGLSVLGMGKLGARELNYSSDVDLLLLFDPHAAAYHEDRAGACYVRVARELVRLLEERTAEGYVFRTDLRLRPDPAATPLAVSMGAAIAYYESVGQNWERAAMIKARPVAGDLALGEHFLREIRPFVWRRHLDFAAIADIHSIKRQIHAHKGARGAGEEAAVAGHDVKLGRGGIREIEFTTQVLQLIWGGRDPGLRDPTTLGALRALVAAGRLDADAASALSDAYIFLRDLEHRLQMVADRQTHRLPEDEAGLARIAAFMGFDGTEAFAEALLGHQSRVQASYAGLFEDAPALSGAAAAEVREAGGNLVFTGTEDDPDTIRTLRRMGFRDPGSVAAMVRSWHHGRPRATRSQRARELLTELMPALLAAFARQVNPDGALVRFGTMLDRLPAGVHVLSLFYRNPALLDRVAGILGAAPALADHLARNPAALDGLLAADGEAPAGGADPAGPLPALVRDARHLDEALEAARRIVTERRFEIDAAALEGALDADTAGGLRADLADAAIQALLPRIEADFADRYGRVPGGALAVVAMGKLGGREMLPGSDLDLVLVYDHDPDATGSAGGRRSLAPSEYFIRLAPQVVSAFASPGAEGRLWEVDMRLRPSGNKGPVAVGIAAFERYHREESWTWERMALTRARVVAGDEEFGGRVAAAVRETLTERREPRKLLLDVADMRRRLEAAHPSPPFWEAKHRPGGLIDIEFIAQYLQLRHAPDRPDVLRHNTVAALQALTEGGVLGEADADALIAAMRLWQRVQTFLKLLVEESFDEASPLAATLARGVGAVDFASLKSDMSEAAGRSRALYEALIAGPAAQAVEAEEESGG